MTGTRDLRVYTVITLRVYCNNTRCCCIAVKYIVLRVRRALGLTVLSGHAARKRRITPFNQCTIAIRSRRRSIDVCCILCVCIAWVPRRTSTTTTIATAVRGLRRGLWVRLETRTPTRTGRVPFLQYEVYKINFVLHSKMFSTLVFFFLYTQTTH